MDARNKAAPTISKAEAQRPGNRSLDESMAHLRQNRTRAAVAMAIILKAARSADWSPRRFGVSEAAAGKRIERAPLQACADCFSNGVASSFQAAHAWSQAVVAASDRLGHASRIGPSMSAGQPSTAARGLPRRNKHPLHLLSPREKERTPSWSAMKLKVRDGHRRPSESPVGGAPVRSFITCTPNAPGANFRTRNSWPGSRQRPR